MAPDEAAAGGPRADGCAVRWEAEGAADPVGEQVRSSREPCSGPHGTRVESHRFCESSGLMVLRFAAPVLEAGGPPGLGTEPIPPVGADSAFLVSSVGQALR